MLKVLFGHQVVLRKEENIGPYEGLQIEVSKYEKLLKNNQNNLEKGLEDPKYDMNFQNGILCTFDDGYKDNITNALPIIEKYGVPCIVFITTGFIESDLIPYEIELANIVKSLDMVETPDMGILPAIKKEEKEALYKKLRLPLKAKNNFKRQQYILNLLSLNSLSKDDVQKCDFLTWDDVSYLDKHPLVTIGAHSHTHPMLNKISVSESYSEIKKSKDILELRLKHRIDYFAYPYGAHSFITRLLVKHIGFKYAFTTNSEVINDTARLNPFSIPRIDMNNYELVMNE
ncbi:MAG: polysaccharide deacetylase family protein [Methanolobus sp.]